MGQMAGTRFRDRGKVQKIKKLAVAIPFTLYLFENLCNILTIKKFKNTGQ